MPEEKPAIRELRNGRYRVREILGAGGFGVTYLCQDVPNNQLCAIKEYLPEDCNPAIVESLQFQYEEPDIDEYLERLQEETEGLDCEPG